MRIAIIIDSLAIGGAQKHVRQLACGLAEQGNRVVVYTLNDIVEPLYREGMVAVGVSVRVVGKANVLCGLGLLRVVWELSCERVDVVLTVLFVSTAFGRVAAQLAGGLPVITCLQARNLDYTWLKKTLMKMTSRLTDLTVSNSRSALVWARDHEGVNPRRSAYIPNAVDPSKPRDTPLPTWTEIGLPEVEGKRVIGSLGRLHWQKGYDILLEMISQIPEAERMEIAVVVFGEGPQRRDLEARRKQLGLDGIVFFPGQRSDASDLIVRFALYVQPSRFEGTPNAVMEAMAAQVPVWASEVDGLAEFARTSLDESVSYVANPLKYGSLEAISKSNSMIKIEASADRQFLMPAAMARQYSSVCCSLLGSSVETVFNPVV